MLLVKTKNKPSNLHGIGLFADQFIPSGSYTWRLEPELDLEKTAAQILQFPENIQDISVGDELTTDYSLIESDMSLLKDFK